MSLSVKLKHFEGPLDLLLHLIDRNKVDIYDIPIAEITDQYIEYLSGMETQDMDIISDFLVMAATLLDIKSRMLLPEEPKEDEDEGDPREELVQRLLEYKLFKSLATELKEKEEIAGMTLFRDPSIPKEVKEYEEPVDLNKVLSDVTLSILKDVLNSVLKRQSDKIDPIRSQYGRIVKETIRVSDKIRAVLNYAKNKQVFSFRGLLLKQENKVEIVVTFQAVLELIKIGRIELVEQISHHDILFETVDTSDITDTEIDEILESSELEDAQETEG